MRLFLALALPALALSGETALPEPTFAGRLPAGIDGGFAARLDSTSGQYLMAERRGMLVAFAFEHKSFVPKCSLPLPAPMKTDYGSPSIGRIAAAGDVDGDGLDEIVVAGSRTIRKYRLVSGAFALTAQAHIGPTPDVRPALCFDVCIGDVNQDSTNEVLLSGVQSLALLNGGGDGTSTEFYACQWTDQRLALIWNDRGGLGLEGPSLIMPITQMRCVCDPTNQRSPRLLLEEGKSDVSASVFDELAWTPHGLHRGAHFVIRDGLIQRNASDNNPQEAAIRCDFARVNGGTAVLAQIHGEESPWHGGYIVFKGDTAAERRSIWADDDFVWWSPSDGIIIDPDGNGPGILRFMYPRPKDGGPRFEFYRL
jgi:hypothetical protein